MLRNTEQIGCNESGLSQISSLKHRFIVTDSDSSIVDNDIDIADDYSLIEDKEDSSIDCDVILDQLTIETMRDDNMASDDPILCNDPNWWLSESYFNDDFEYDLDFIDFGVLI